MAELWHLQSKDVKKETYDEKHIDDETEKNLGKARHLKKLTVYKV